MWLGRLTDTFEPFITNQTTWLSRLVVLLWGKSDSSTDWTLNDSSLKFDSQVIKDLRRSQE